MADAALNPKHAAGAARPNYRHVPASGLYAVGKVMDLGAAKYGPFNWRSTGLCLQTYIDAIRRHTDALAGGQNIDPESGESHMAHVAACALLVLDCIDRRNLVDDRPTILPA